MDIWFDGIAKPVRLVGGAEDLLPLIHDILTTWPFREDKSGDTSAIITIKTSNGDYVRTSPWLLEPKIYRDPVNAVCDFIVDLVHAYNEDHPDQLCLHSAAAILNDHGVVFPNGYNQGKSTFMTILAEKKVRILCDDVMPLNLSAFTGQGLGVQPRLRHPLPSGLGASFYEFVHGHQGPGSQRFQYLKLGVDQLASFGETVQIGGIVILERNEETIDSLEHASQADALRAIILRNFAKSMPAPDILDGLCSLIEQVKVFRLNYHSVAKAVEMLQEAFGVNTVQKSR